MKLKFLIALILFFTIIGQAATPPQASGPLTKDEVMNLVKFGMSGADLAKKIKDLGIDFDLTDDYLQALRQAGAPDVVIQALREVRPRPLTREQVGKLVAGGVPSQRAAVLVEQHGIDFLPDEDYLKTLRLAGADDTLINALRTAGKAVPAPGAVRSNSKDGLKYVWIAPGSFQMGCSPGDTECGGDEKPPHQVSITKGFWLGQTEVTVGAYKRFTGATGRHMPDAPTFNSSWANDSMPILNVTWNDAHDYCTWAGGRVPSEAEWEYAARAGSTEARYGSLDEVAWYSANSGSQTHPVGEKRVNGFGLFDMLGNVWEWVNDWCDQNYYQSSPSQDPTGPTSGTLRVLRGGSWVVYPRFVRVSFRTGFDPAYRFDVGLRCAREVFAP